MPIPEGLRRLLLPGGLVVGFLGMALVVVSFSNGRTLDLTYLYVMLLATALVMLGVILAALGRALAPRGLAAKRRKNSGTGAAARRVEVKAAPASSKADAAPPPQARPAAVDASSASAAASGSAASGSSLDSLAPETSASVDPPASIAVAASGSVPRARLRCPDCGTVFSSPADGALAVCPSCGAEGDVPILAHGNALPPSAA